MNKATLITLLICLVLLPFAVVNLVSWTSAFSIERLEPVADAALTVLPWIAGIWFIFGRGGCCGARRCRPSRRAAHAEE